jgi:hypothetical protein
MTKIITIHGEGKDTLRVNGSVTKTLTCNDHCVIATSNSATVSFIYNEDMKVWKATVLSRPLKGVLTIDSIALNPENGSDVVSISGPIKWISYSGEVENIP